MERVGKKVFLPNTPSVGMLLYRMKHMVKITPLKFPNGIPENFDPNVHGFDLSADGKFTITEHQTGESVESLSKRADWMKIDPDQVEIFYQNWPNIFGPELTEYFLPDPETPQAAVEQAMGQSTGQP